MRKFPHPFKASLLARKLKFCRQAFATYGGPQRAAALKEKRREFFFRHMSYGLQTARLMYLFDGPLNLVITTLRRPLPDLILGNEFGQQMTPTSLPEYLGVALAVRDTKTAAWMAGLPRKSWTKPDGKYAEVELLIPEALQAGVWRDKIVFARHALALRKALTQLDSLPEPEVSRAYFEPKVAILESIAANDPGGLERAWASQAKSWASQFPRASEAGNIDAFLDVETLGYGRLARNFGFKVPDSSPYAPVALLDEADRHP